jgi:hypothetical protein
VWSVSCFYVCRPGTITICMLMDRLIYVLEGVQTRTGPAGCFIDV